MTEVWLMLFIVGVVCGGIGWIIGYTIGGWP